jgi:hypothetical protein
MSLYNISINIWMSPLTSQALDWLIHLYKATNKPDEAKKRRAERAKYPEAPMSPKKRTPGDRP